MSFYFEGNACLTHSFLTNTTVTSSYITTSTLDMNLENITSVKDPILPQDAATKKYVDDQISGFSSLDIVLTGTVGTQIATHVKGTYMVKVSNSILDGPSALFNITKIESNKSSQIVRPSASAGATGTTTLTLDWDATGIFLRKTNSLYDGTYSVTII